ncbi:MAG: NAD(P)-dependent glycerol-3-phosphate dehydrogenase [Saprospiraceae bacterium]|jgi:glycerol-3-phosphate dehydrogenase (NAD(P)+)|nr:NAD(P)-dependent glycerol-3-phosphate dehydrogenase [Saprospiraceae bacterium]
MKRRSKNKLTPGTIGVVGSGSFGKAIANLLALNCDVLMFTRRSELVSEINNFHNIDGFNLSERIIATSDLHEIAEKCKVIFPVVPSNKFREMMQSLGPLLTPAHILIHGTKGFDLVGVDYENITNSNITRDNIRTMSDVILEESSVIRVGCLSGPNLSAEIMEGQPTASLIASHFDEVIQIGQAALNSPKFHLFGSHGLLGAELAGALKNIFAIGSGVLAGVGLGRNIQAMLISRGLIEMIYFGKAMGAEPEDFLGTAGVGDLIATATSTQSRNYMFGTRLGKGEKFNEIMKTMPELAEGVRTLKISQELAKHYKLHVPITSMLYNIVYNNLNIDRAINMLMSYPFNIDVDFL